MGYSLPQRREADLPPSDTLSGRRLPPDSDAATISGPHLLDGSWVWSASLAGFEARFVGRTAGSAAGVSDLARTFLPAGRHPAWAEQVHGRNVVAATSGNSGPGDALHTSDRTLGLLVVTADCVPIVLGGREGPLAVVHAGWRGLEAGVVPAAVDALGVEPASLRALLGPAIGSCCYEVGEDVAQRIEAVSGAEVVVGSHPPHLDLQAVAIRQLSDAGVLDVGLVARCTSCDSERLHSYRRDGNGAGRNLTLAWMK